MLSVMTGACLRSISCASADEVSTSTDWAVTVIDWANFYPKAHVGRHRPLGSRRQRDGLRLVALERNLELVRAREPPAARSGRPRR